MNGTGQAESKPPRLAGTVRAAGGWIVRGLFSLGIAILFLLLLRAISTQIQPPPDPFDGPYPITNTKERCEAEGGAWVEGEPRKAGPAVRPAPLPEGGTVPEGFCQGPLRFERERNAQQRKADVVSFFVHLVGGSVALVGALPLMRVTPVAPGFLLAGVIALIVSTTKLWQFAGNIVRLVTILVLLILVAAAGAYFLRERKEQSS